jgi:hypothetical protein
MPDAAALRELYFFAGHEVAGILREYAGAKRSRRRCSAIAFAGQICTGKRDVAENYLTGATLFYLDVEVALERLNRAVHPGASRLLVGYFIGGATWRELADELHLPRSRAQDIARAATFQFLFDVRERGILSPRAARLAAKE